jgi:hypothetical protein
LSFSIISYQLFALSYSEGATRFIYLKIAVVAASINRSRFGISPFLPGTGGLLLEIGQLFSSRNELFLEISRLFSRTNELLSSAAEIFFGINQSLSSASELFLRIIELSSGTVEVSSGTELRSRESSIIPRNRARFLLAALRRKAK